MKNEDAELLRLYLSEGSQEAFGQLVSRHISFVFSAALRRLNGDVHRASDASQIVFAALARHAPRLTGHPALAGWLYLATRHAVIDLARAKKRRLAREAQAVEMQAAAASELTMEWEKLRPLLDQQLDKLSGPEREVILLRFLQSKSFSEIGGLLGISDEAARKRTDRALQALRRRLSRRGIASSAAALGLLLESETIVAAPPGLAASIITSESIGSLSIGSLGLMAATKIQIAVVTCLLLGGGTALVWPRHALLKFQNAQLESHTKSDAETTAKSPFPFAQTLANPKPGAEQGPRPENNEMASNPLLAAATPLRSDPPEHPVALPAHQSSSLTRLHQRYDSFLKQLGLPQAAADRWIELMDEKDNIRLDLQAAMREQGVPGGSKEIEELRSKLTGPLWKQMFDLLGPEGSSAFHDFEERSAYRANLAAWDAQFSTAKAPLTAEQSDQLITLVVANNHPKRERPNDLGETSHLDWSSIEQQAKGFLDPTQQTVLRAIALGESSE